jgi:hypothetical protein
VVSSAVSHSSSWMRSSGAALNVSMCPYASTNTADSQLGGLRVPAEHPEAVRTKCAPRARASEESHPAQCFAEHLSLPQLLMDIKVSTLHL